MSIKTLCSKHKVTHYTKSQVEGTEGSLTPSQAKGTVHSCFIQPARSSDQIVAMQQETEISHVIYYDHDPSIEKGAEVTFGTRKFEVTARAVNFDEDDQLWKVFCNEKDRDN